MENVSAIVTIEEVEWFQYDDYYFNDSCEGNMTAKFIYLDSLKGLQTGILWSYLVTMIVGLFGNSLVIYIIARNSQIRNKSVANYYIWNLALADLCFVLMMPLFCYSTYCDDWPFGTPICKLSRVFFEINRYASMFTLVALSFDRYLASFYNMAHLRTVKAGVIVCCVIWILCAIISTPYWIYTDAEDRKCRTVFPTNFLKFWTFFQLTIALLVPLILICVSYILLAARLQMILRASSASSSSIQKPSKKMMRTIITIVVLFLVCQLPWHVHEIILLQKHFKYDILECMPTIPELKLTMYLNTAATILGFISSCCNPIVYGILNDNYRKEYIAALCCCCYRRVPISNGFQAVTQRGSTQRRGSNGDPAAVTGTYKFQVAFFRPCFKGSGQQGAKHAPGHPEMCLVSQDGTHCHGAITEQIELDVILEGKKDVAVQHEGPGQ